MHRRYFLILSLITSALWSVESMAAGACIADTIPDDSVSLGSVTVYAKSQGKKLEEGAYSVNAVEMLSNVNRLVNLNNLVDRSAGVKVRRQGGLGSDFDLSINGLSGNSIRYFIDGVPLDTKGSDVNLDNIPVNTVERVELYKGVVPAYLSADALGGAVNIVTKRSRSNYLDVSYGAGSFHTQSADLTAQYYIPGTAVSIRPTVSYSYSKNDYMMKDVEVWDDEADRYIHTDRRRFHDDYRSVIAQVEAGVSRVSWADMFSVGGSFAKVEKEIQTGAMQNKVYGMPTRNSRSWNLSARYTKRWDRINTRITLSHTWDCSETVDTAFRKYSWDGTWLPASGNEMTGKDRTVRVYKRPLTVANAGADYDINEHHNVAFNYMLNRTSNRRHDKLDRTFEPSRDVVTKQIISLTYTQTFFDTRWQTSYFVKDYINRNDIRQTDNATVTGANLVKPHEVKSYWGAGVGSRYRFFEPLAVKASYEHSVRLPLSRELLGNGTTIIPNVALRPEASNNYNLGVFGTWHIDGDNLLTYEADGFIRHVQNYIRAVVSERDGYMQYANEPAIDVKGIDLEIGYTWRDALSVTLNGSWSDARNLRKYKSDGNPSATYKNRVPNRPWMYANAQVSYTLRELFGHDNRLRIECDHQWIHWYYLNWEAYGAKESKAVIPTQSITDLSVAYSWYDGRYNLSLECTNMFDRLAYDNYMLQKPGRAVYAKFRLFLN